jgi:hypothetical protein
MSADGFVGRKPDYILSVKIKNSTAPGHRCGVAWLNDDGSISMQLRPCTTLKWNDGCHISLFPNKEREPSKPNDQPEAPF